MLEASQDRRGIKRRTNVVKSTLVKDERKGSGSGAADLRQRPVVDDVCLCGASTDGRTVKGITYYDQGETPGLRRRSGKPAWRKTVHRQKVLDDSGMPALKAVKGGARQGDDYAVDGLSGATLTSNGVHTVLISGWGAGLWSVPQSRFVKEA